MEKEKVRQIVYGNYEKGFHCAEAIVRSVLDTFQPNGGNPISPASGFCGGIGECKQDVCGALSGGIIALGFLYGRETGGDDISKLKLLSFELRRLFIERFGSTVCRDVVEKISHTPGYNGCRDVTAETASILLTLIETGGEK